METRDYRRRLTYLFLTLPYVTRLTIALRLNLIREEDEKISGNGGILFSRYFHRAEEAGKLGSLWKETVLHNRLSLESESSPFVDR